VMFSMASIKDDMAVSLGNKRAFYRAALL